MGNGKDKWRPDEDVTLQRLHADGLSQGAVAQQMRRSKSTVSHHSIRLGLAWDREQTVQAVQAAARDAKTRRAELEIKLLDDAERLRAQIWRKTEYIDHGGKDYVEVKWTLKEPTPADKLKLMQAATSAIDKSLRISNHDTDDGAAEAASMLSRLAEGLGVPMSVQAPPPMTVVREVPGLEDEDLI